LNYPKLLCYQGEQGLDALPHNSLLLRKFGFFFVKDFDRLINLSPLHTRVLVHQYDWGNFLTRRYEIFNRLPNRNADRCNELL